MLIRLAELNRAHFNRTFAVVGTSSEATKINCILDKMSVADLILSTGMCKRAGIAEVSFRFEGQQTLLWSHDTRIDAILPIRAQIVYPIDSVSPLPTPRCRLYRWHLRTMHPAK